MAPISMIFGPNESQRCQLKFEKILGRRKNFREGEKFEKLSRKVRNFLARTRFLGRSKIETAISANLGKAKDPRNVHSVQSHEIPGNSGNRISQESTGKLRKTWESAGNSLKSLKGAGLPRGVGFPRRQKKQVFFGYSQPISMDSVFFFLGFVDKSRHSLPISEFIPRIMGGLHPQ